MGKVLLLLLALLALLGALFAHEMDWIDLDKALAKEEVYTPPSQFGRMWRWDYGPGDSHIERFLNRVEKHVFFEVKPSGEWVVTGSVTCTNGGWRCW